MAPRTAVRRRGLPAAVIATLVVALAVGVIALAMLAIDRGRGVAPTGEARPAPSFSFDATTPRPTPSGGVSDPVDVDAPGANERFLAASGDIVWRATAGACDGPAPVVERSSDGGETWDDVTPAYRDIAQVRDLLPFDDTEADMVGDLGSDCDTALLRTFTQGSFWSPYEDLLPRFTYRVGADVMIDSEAVAAPCAEPWSVRAAGERTALICDGTAYERVGERWGELATGVVALDVLGDEIVGATVDSACSGLAMTALDDGRVLGCADSASADTAAAVALTADDVWLWSGDALITVTR